MTRPHSRRVQCTLGKLGTVSYEVVGSRGEKWGEGRLGYPCDIMSLCQMCVAMHVRVHEKCEQVFMWCVASFSSREF